MNNLSYFPRPPRSPAKNPILPPDAGGSAAPTPARTVRFVRTVSYAVNRDGAPDACYRPVAPSVQPRRLDFAWKIDGAPGLRTGRRRLRGRGGLILAQPPQIERREYHQSEIQA